MSKYWNYLKLIFQFKDVSEVYKEENQGAEKPGWISRRFWGVVVAFLGAALTVVFGIVLDPTVIATLPDLITAIATGLKTIIPPILTLYGIILGIIGKIKQAKKDANK